MINLLAIFLISLTHLGALILGIWIATRLRENKSILPSISKKYKPISRSDKEEYYLERKKEKLEE